MRQLLGRLQQSLADRSSHTGKGDILVLGRCGRWNFAGGGSGLGAARGGSGGGSTGVLLDVGLRY